MSRENISTSELPLPAAFEYAFPSPVHSTDSTAEHNQHFDPYNLYGNELLNIPMRDDNAPDGRTNGAIDSTGSGIGGEHIGGGFMTSQMPFGAPLNNGEFDQPTDSFVYDLNHHHYPVEGYEHLLGDLGGVASLEPIADLTGAMPSSRPNGRRGKRRSSGNSSLAKVTKARKPPKRKNIKTEVIKKELKLPPGFDIILSQANFADTDVKIPRRKEHQRRETKFMLVNPDGNTYTKFYDEENMKTFVNHFKERRRFYGISQYMVADAFDLLYGIPVSQTTISRFESMLVKHSNMCHLRPLLEQWLTEVEQKVAEGYEPRELLKFHVNATFWTPNANSNLVPPFRLRKKRTCLNAVQKYALQTFFAVNPRPGHARIMDISENLTLDYEAVCNWFSNSRQKMKRDAKNDPQSILKAK